MDEPSQDDEFYTPEIVGNSPVARAASALFCHEAVLSRKALLQRSLAEARLRGRGIESVCAEITALEQTGKLRSLTQGPAQYWTTPAIAVAEAAMLRATDREQGLWFDDAAINSALSNAPQLSSEQKQAVLHATSSDPISVIQARAGTGKTTLASVIVRAAEGSQIRVLGLAAEPCRCRRTRKINRDKSNHYCTLAAWCGERAN